ncbi:hypothetical protein [Phenylobacterium koreense]|uniref:Peptidase S74 domain-containing protein n=1 Tax=Phenylobacterium koreense TaxID=266125 RepID=A0ABV2EJR3_9CAUL
MMRPSMFMGGSLGSAQYVGSLFQAIGPSSTINLAAAGAQVGDYAFVSCVTNTSGYFSAISSGWNVDNFTFGAGYYSSVFHRRITSLDVTIAHPFGGGAMIGVYRGASRAARRSVVNDNAIANPVLTIPGFTRNTDCVGVVSMAQSRLAGQSTAVPSGDFVRRGIDSPDLFTQAFGDALARDDYVDGANVTWNPLTDYCVGMLYEMRL